MGLLGSAVRGPLRSGAAAVAAAWLGLAMLGAPAARAGEAVEARQGIALIELFTSQGCSSCPPADRLLGEISSRTGVVALTFPVDYWDYLGWKDTFASPANTARQKAYAAARGDGEVYTPQVVINGVVHAVGSRPDAVDAAIAAASAQVQAWRAPLSADVVKGVLNVSAGAAPGGPEAKAGTIWVAEYRSIASVAVKRGENSGSKLSYHNLVRRLAKVGDWDGTAATYKVNLAGKNSSSNDGCVVFLQRGNGGPIVAAVELRAWSHAF